MKQYDYETPSVGVPAFERKLQEFCVAQGYTMNNAVRGYKLKPKSDVIPTCDLMYILSMCNHTHWAFYASADAAGDVYLCVYESSVVLNFEEYHG